MNSEFSQTLQRKFEATLRQLPGESPVDKLRSYYDSLRKRQEDRRKDASYDSSHRFKSRKFFYFPGENPREVRNCFESSIDLFMAAQELYPESQPRLYQVDEGPRGKHSLVLFQHNGLVWGGDPNYRIFSPVVLSDKGLEHTSIKGESAVTKLKTLEEIPQEELDRLTTQLRASDGSGFYYFLNNSGQAIEVDNEAFRPYGFFMKLIDGKLVSELRFVDFPSNLNLCVRRKTDPRTRLMDLEFLTYGTDNWSVLDNETIVASNSESAPWESGVKLDCFQSLRSLRKGNVDEFLFGATQYYYALTEQAKKRHASLRDSFLWSKKQREWCLDHLTPGFEEYLKDHTDHFRNHTVDYCILMGDKVLREWINKDKLPAKKTLRPRDVIRSNIHSSIELVGRFVQVTQRLSKVPRKRLRDYEKQAFEFTIPDEI